MTTTTVRPAESTSTPESQDPAKLELMLRDPALVGFDREIREAIAELRARAEQESQR